MNGFCNECANDHSCNSNNGCGNMLWLLILLSCCGGNGCGGNSCCDNKSGGIDCMTLLLLMCCCGGKGGFGC